MTPLDIDLYERLGLDCSPIIELLLRCVELGFNMVLLTCTPNGARETRNKFLRCRNLGLTKGKFKSNACFLFDDTIKPYYNCLLDDRAGLKETYTALKKLVDEIQDV